MGKIKIGLIGIVHEAAAKDFWGTMRRVREIGYQGIEGAEPLFKGDVAANLAQFHALGLKVLTVSASMEQLQNDVEAVIARATSVQSPRVTVWWAECKSKDEILREAATLNAAGAKLAAQGLKLCYHNHDQEFRNRFNGVYALDLLAEYTDPAAVYFNIDIAWVTMGGEDPVKILEKMAGRVPAIHVKDFWGLDDRSKFTAPGTGVVHTYQAVQAAIDTGVEWAVVEQDTLRNLTAFETITLGYLYLKEAGLV